MTKLFSALALALICTICKAQNTFPASGNVGIGTTTPAANLDVVLSTNGASIIRIANVNTGSAALQLNSQGGSTYLGRTSNAYSPTAFANSFVIQEGIGDIILSGVSEIARFRQNGRVGIGTINTNDAGYKLFVETGIRTRKVTVDQSTWPDYVFHPSYVLPSLDSVSYFIKKNNHLLDMPSADSVAKNGIDLGSNQAVLGTFLNNTQYYDEKGRSVQSLDDNIKGGPALEYAGRRCTALIRLHP